jgi:hypothetical protein
MAIARSTEATEAVWFVIVFSWWAVSEEFRRVPANTQQSCQRIVPKKNEKDQ